jgi:hypothetical protein
MQKIGDCTQGYLCRGSHRIPECPGGNGGEAYAGTRLYVGLFNGIAVAALEDLRLVDLAALPHGAYRVDHISSLKIGA